MKTSCAGIMVMGTLMLFGCGPRPTDQSSGLPDQDAQTEKPVDPAVSDKYLITDYSVGFFRLGGPWQDAATRQYGYKSIQGYGSCTDACCDGGFDLGFRIEDGDFGKEMADLQVKIGAVLFSDSESADEFRDSPGVFYSSSPNCSGWYWSDKIGSLTVTSSQFRTKEGVGVGSTLASMQEKFGKLNFYAGWIEEDQNALQVMVSEHPDVRFVLSYEDYLGDWEKINLAEEKNSLTAANFRKGTSIRRVMVERR